MATNKTMRHASKKVKCDPLITYDWVKYEFESGWENYFKQNTKILTFCNKRDKNVEKNDLFKYFEDRQKKDKFTLIEVFYQPEDEAECGIGGLLEWGYFGYRYIIKTIHPDNSITKEVKFSDSNKHYRVDSLLEVINDVDLVVCNPMGYDWDVVYSIVVDSGKKYAIWGHQQKILNDSPRVQLMQGKVWGGNTHNRTMTFYYPDEGIIKRTPGFSVFTNCDITLTKRTPFVPTKLSEKLIKEGLMYHYDNSPIMYNVDETSNIPCDFDGDLLIPVSGLFTLDKNFYTFKGNVNGKMKNEAIGQYVLDKMGGVNKSGNFMEVTLPIINGKIKASRSIITRKKVSKNS